MRSPPKGSGLVMPHVCRTMQIRDSLQPTAASMIEAVLEAIPEAAFVCDPQGRVLHANERAKVADRAGVTNLRSRETERAVATLVPEWTRRLLGCIASAGQGEAGGTTRIASKAFAVVAPLMPTLKERLGLSRGRVLVLVGSESILSQSLVRNVRTLFDLTEAEADVACALATGSNPGEIAAHRDVRVSTVRTLLERAMSKTDVDNLRRLTAPLATISTQI